MPLNEGSRDWAAIYRRMYVTVNLLIFVVVVLVIMVVALEVQVQRRNTIVRDLETTVETNSSVTYELDQYLRGLVEAQRQQANPGVYDKINRIEEKLNELASRGSVVQ